MWEIIFIIVGILIIATFFDKWEKRKKENHKNSDVSPKAKESNNHKFESVNIGDQVWMSKNLSISTFRNGDPIDEIQDIDQWGLKSHKKGMPLCYYPNNEISEIMKYGRLYNYHVLQDPRGLAPEGWRVPTVKDWQELIEYLGGREKAINKIKSRRGWKSGLNGSNSSGFNALPAGYLTCDAYPNTYSTEFVAFGYMSLWWTMDIKGQEDEHVKTVVKLVDNINNETFGKMLLGDLDASSSKSYNPDLYEETYVPYSACSIRLIQDK